MTTKKTYKFLKPAQGVREGDVYPTKFQKDDIAELDESLAEQFYHQAAITEVAPGSKANPADSRETKISGPAESKEGEAGVPTSTQHIEELNSVARDHYGLDTDTTMSRSELKQAVDEAGAGNDVDLPKSEAEPLTTQNATKPKNKK
ncbi:hypothetical protein TA3x_000460 [Tundrisphaera sp. TA3]|uniref:hypothetical protein n=1 Tax=Tundrisphaera sp. TA3 TaxID=3435775 RepID=UPI003EBAEA11